jgi:hypothetical protein
MLNNHAYKDAYHMLAYLQETQLLEYEFLCTI